jgi:hypothetical protein
MFLFLFCAVCLTASLIMHAPISGLHAQWHRCLHCRMNLHSKRLLQFYPTVMMVAYFNSCLFFLAESVKILIRPRAGFPLADIFPQQTSRMHNKRSPKVIWIDEYIVIHTWIYVRDVFWTDISCLGGVFAKNTSRETNNLKTGMFRKYPSKYDIFV